jgi:hypothetical protein
MEEKQPGLGVSTMPTRMIVLLVLAMSGLMVVIVAFFASYSSAFEIVR